MEQVYKLGLWGVGMSAFYSGTGSHNTEVVEPYLKVIQQFLRMDDGNLSVADLGCGDFNIGSKLVAECKEYKAVDIVPDLIAHNQRHFKSNNLTFACIDLAKDELPSADCAILRQVLQHLSNREIKLVTKKLQQYQYILLTEHLPDHHFEANKDIISGQGIRLKKNSGVDLLAAPFNLTPKSTTELLRVKSPVFKGVIVTTLFEMF